MKINSLYFKNNDTGVSTVDFTGGNAKDVSQDSVMEYLQYQINSLHSYLNINFNKFPTNNVKRNVGEIVLSALPLRDINLHLLDGSIISGDGEFKDFVDFIKSYVDDCDTEEYQEIEKFYTLQGTPTYNNGVVSGFNASNYVEGTEFFKPAENPWEKYITFTTGSASATTSEVIWSQAPEYTIKFGTMSGKFRIWMSSKGTEFDIANTNDCNVAVENNTKYYAKIEFTGTQYKVYISKEQKYENPSLVLDSSKPFKSGYKDLYGTQLHTVNFSGSIDLKNTYGIIHEGESSEVKDTYVYLEHDVTKTRYIPKYDFIVTEKTWKDLESTYGVVAEFAYNKEFNYVRLPKFSGEFDLEYFKDTSTDSTEQKHHQYMYICLANGDFTTAEIKNKQELVNPYNLFDIKREPTDNLAWLKSDGTFYSGDLYKSAYEKVLEIGEEYSTNHDQSSVYTYNSEDKTFRLPLKYNGPRILIESKSASDTDKNWYNLYSDGYVEQGGVFEGENTTFAIKFPKAFLNKNYSLIVQPLGQVNTNNVVIDPNGKELLSCTCYKDTADTKVEFIARGFTSQPNSPLYYYVGDVAKNSDLIDFGRVNDELYKFSQRPYIVKSQFTGSTCYVVFSNGFCMQWSNSWVTGNTVSLPIIMANTNYIAQIQLWREFEGYGTSSGYVTDKYVSSFSTWNHYNGTTIRSVYKYTWFVMGLCDTTTTAFANYFGNSERTELQKNTQDIKTLNSEITELKARIKELEDSGMRIVDVIPDDVHDNTLYFTEESGNR